MPDPPDPLTMEERMQVVSDKLDASERKLETESAIAEATVSPAIATAQAVPAQAQSLVLKSEHIFDPPDVLPVVITQNRKRPFRFTRNFRYQIRYRGRTVLDLEIPEGFECDLGSFPWFARWLPGLTQAGQHVRGLAIHDFLYRTQILDKITSDMIAREVMLIDSVHWTMRWMITFAVLVGGRSAWNENERLLKENPE